MLTRSRSLAIFLFLFTLVLGVSLATSLIPHPALAAGNLTGARNLEVAEKTSTKVKEVSVEDGVYTISSAAKRSAMLDISGASSDDNAKIQAWSNNWTPVQRWRFTRLSDGTYRITNVATGKALGVSKPKITSGTSVRQSSWKASKAQKWKVKKSSTGYALVSALSNKYALCFAGGKAANGTAAGMYAIRTAKKYRLALKRITPAIENGTYLISCQASGKAIQAAGGRIENGTNIQQGAKGTSLERVFSFTYNKKSGYYRILSAASGLALDVAGAQNADGANVQLYKSNGSRAQQWAIVKNADGTFTLRSATGGRALDVQGASKSYGANVQLYSSNKTDAQKWRLKVKARWLPNATYTFACGANTTIALAVASSSKAKGANIETAGRANVAAQKWTVTYNKKAKAYTIRNENSKLMLKAAGSAKSGANVYQAKANGKRNELWIPRIVAGGIVFSSASNPKVALSVAGSGKSTGANALVSTDKSKTAQKFRLRNTKLPQFKVYLNPGHGWNSNGNGVYDPGAQGSGYREADFTHELARLVQAYCESYGIEVVNGEQFSLPYWERLPKAVSLGCNAIVSIHFDWSGAGTSGTHTMVGVQGKAEGSDLLNDIIHRHLVAATGLNDLGTFSRSDITAVNGDIPSMLMEVCFMDNAYDVDTYLSRKDSIAKAIAQGILEASQQPSLN